MAGSLHGLIEEGAFSRNAVDELCEDSAKSLLASLKKQKSNEEAMQLAQSWVHEREGRKASQRAWWVDQSCVLRRKLKQSELIQNDIEQYFQSAMSRNERPCRGWTKLLDRWSKLKDQLGEVEHRPMGVADAAFDVRTDSLLFDHVWFRREAVILDVETTGFRPSDSEIIELAMVRFSYNAVYWIIEDIVDVYSGLKQPRRPIPTRITKINGITDRMVKGKTLCATSIARVGHENAVVIAHNAKFDRGFVYDELYGFDEAEWACSCFDVPWPSMYPVSDRKLDTLRQYFDINCGTAHRALGDVDAVLQLMATPAHLCATLHGSKARLLPGVEYRAGLSAVEACGARESSPVAEVHDWGAIARWCPSRATAQETKTAVQEVLDIAKTSRAGFDYQATCEQLGVRASGRADLAVEVFTSLARRAWADGKFTAKEAKTLSWFAKRLGIPLDAAKRLLRAEKGPR